MYGSIDPNTGMPIFTQSSETIVSKNSSVAKLYAGPQGPMGYTGPAGPGVPTGGDTGQILGKTSGSDYDTEWVDPSGGGGMTIGGAVSGADPYKGLFADAAGDLAQTEYEYRDLVLGAGILTIQGEYGVAMDNVARFAFDASGLGGGEAVGVAFKAGVDAQYTILNADDFTQYFTITKNAIEQSSAYFGADTVAHIDPVTFSPIWASGASGVQFGNAGATVTSFDDDVTLAADLDTLIPTQHAVKTYVDTEIAGSAGTPGGSDTQMQYNDAGAFGGMVWAYSDSVGTVTGRAVADLPSTGTQDILVIKDNTVNHNVFQFREDRSGSNFRHIAKIGYLHHVSSSTDVFLYEQDTTTGAHLFRGFSSGANNTFGIRIGTANNTFLDATNLTIAPTGTLTLEGATLNISAGPAIGHAALFLKTSNGAGFLQDGSNNRRRIKIKNGVATTDASVQFSVETDIASYVGFRINAGVATPTANLMEIARNGTLVGGIDSRGVLFATLGQTGTTAIGTSAGNITASGTNNTIIGASAMTALTTGNQNTGIGLEALGGTTTGSFNFGLGSQAGKTLTTGTYNVFMGMEAGKTVAGAIVGAVAIGYQAGMTATGNYLVAIGYQAARNSVQQRVIGIGVQALYNNTGDYTIGMGYQAGYQSGSGGVYLGYQAGYNETGNNKLYIANSNTTTPLIYGDFSSSALEINGSLKVTGNLGLFNTTPIAQPTTAIAASTFVTNTSLIANDTATFDGYTIGQVVKALRNFGLLA